MKIKHLPQHHPGLGRSIEHDPRSLRFAAPVLPRSVIKSVQWQRRIPILDQGELGSCTGNAGTGWVGTDNKDRQGLTLVGGKPVDETFAVGLYSLATVLDGLSGTYPPTDSGSSGLGVAKALQKDTLCTSYTHAFSIDAAYAALQSGPVLLGIPWYNSMFDPKSDGRVPVDPKSGLAGGHEIVCGQLVVENGVGTQIWFDNSWATSWGKEGRGYFIPEDLTTLLADDGDVTCPQAAVVPQPAPPLPPSPSPTPTGSLVMTVNDPGVIAHVNSAAALRKVTDDAWLTHHLQGYFGVA
ncbi:MAG TPA: hypothetical protein VGI59_09570 [Candidatus Udaeobacter sp.]|jgi:hypothetical protein